MIRLIAYFFLLAILAIFVIRAKKLAAQNTDNTSMLKKTSDRYLNKIIGQWFITTIIFLIYGSFQVLISPLNILTGLNPQIKITLMLLSFIFAVASMFPVILSWLNESRRRSLLISIREIPYPLPQTKKEALLYTLVGVTTGFGEELMYRGFLIRLLVDLPFGINSLQSLVIISILFGLAHFYQGIGGMIMTCLFGLSMGVIFFITGNLLVPILLHTIIFLRFFLIPGFYKEFVLRENKI